MVDRAVVVVSECHEIGPSLGKSWKSRSSRKLRYSEDEIEMDVDLAMRADEGRMRLDADNSLNSCLYAIWLP